MTTHAADHDPRPDAPGAVPSLSYAEALVELDAILDQLERGDADIDALAARVGRAAELVRSCRARLDEARLEVSRIVADLDTDGGTADGGTTDGGGDPGVGGADTPADGNGARDTRS